MPSLCVCFPFYCFLVSSSSIYSAWVHAWEMRVGANSDLYSRASRPPLSGLGWTHSCLLSYLLKLWNKELVIDTNVSLNMLLASSHAYSFWDMESKVALPKVLQGKTLWNLGWEECVFDMYWPLTKQDALYMSLPLYFLFVYRVLPGLHSNPEYPVFSASRSITSVSSYSHGI